MVLLPFDLIEVPMEDNIVDEDIDEKENIDEPFVGQCFLSEEEAFVFYVNYARMKGFSVRKGRFKNKNGMKKRCDFFCYRQGKAETKVVDYSKQQRNQGSSRCECKAYMRIKLKRINEIFPEEWQVTKFVTDHNHVLLSTQKVDLAIEEVEQRQIHETILEKYRDLFEVPSTYWPLRWRRDELQQLNDTSPTPHEEINTDLTCLKDAIDLVECPPKSKPKGRLKKIRPKGGIELIKQERHCGLCKGVGHYFTTCPERENFGYGPTPQRAKKKKKIAKENEDLNPIFCLKC
nr:protein FAR1-related sequence 11 [Tanacetum cinerariifolium]